MCSQKMDDSPTHSYSHLTFCVCKYALPTGLYTVYRYRSLDLCIVCQRCERRLGCSGAEMVETPETTAAQASEALTPSEEQRDWMEAYWRQVREEHEEKLSQLQERNVTENA